MTKVVFPVALAVLVLLVGGCPNPATSSGSASPKSSGGSLTIILPMLPARDSNGKSPDLTVPAFYDVSGAGPGGSSFLRVGITESSVTIDSLAPGAWDVTVNQNSLNGVQLAAASLQVTVIEGETATKDIGVSSTLADGKVDMSAKWPEIRGISLQRALLAANGVSIDVTLPPALTSNGVTSISATAAIPAGYYTLSRVFSDGTGGADAVRVTSGATTTFSLSVLSGAPEVVIAPDISKVIPATFNGYKPVIGKSTSMTLVARPETSKQFNSFSFAWYLDGVLLPSQTTDTILVSGDSGVSGMPGSLPSGLHRLDVVIASHGVLSSYDVLFRIP